MPKELFSEDIKKLISTPGKKVVKKVKTFYLSEDTIRKIMELYMNEGGRQSKIVEKAVDLYYRLYKILGKEGLEKLENDKVLEKLKSIL
jgi:flagellar biosynthesis/type III secretory pathway ATPase